MPLCPFSAMKSAVLGVRSQAVLRCVVPQATGRAVSDGRCWLWPGSCAHNRRSVNVAFDCAHVPPPRSLSLRPRLVRCLSRRRAPASVAVLCAPAPPPRSLSLPHRRPLFSRTRAPAIVVSRNRAPTAVRSFCAPAPHVTLSKQRTACARARCEVRMRVRVRVRGACPRVRCVL